ncbi:MAG: bifunctional phosphopantothenoylcysteine decarboxylase/phosphopantothenate--cysteine ligase CoaBC [Bacteroidota bacterium]
MKGKKIIIGISGGIAAYKAAYLVRILVKKGAEVKVVVTSNALEFVTKVTLETLSKNKIYDNVFGENNDYSTEHISLTDWADIMIVAPATANIIGKFANGIADDALSTTFMAFNKDVFVAPSMNTKMYNHYSFQHNLNVLRHNGVHIIEPADGFLACGYEGKGRMEEPESIVNFIENYYFSKLNFNNKKILITAGPTVESIDPVRYISNYSSGKMGYALANQLTQFGADVTLISGPTSLLKPDVTNFISVKSAEDMHLAVIDNLKTQDVIIMSAAVADYTPKIKATNKIKKSDNSFSIELVKTKDILFEVGKKKTNKQLLVGFALETDNEIDNAKQKLDKKNLDFIVLNSLKDDGAGFGTDTNKVTFISKDNKIEKFELKSKSEVALDIVNYIYKLIKKQK